MLPCSLVPSLSHLVCVCVSDGFWSRPFPFLLFSFVSFPLRLMLCFVFFVRLFSSLPSFFCLPYSYLFISFIPDRLSSTLSCPLPIDSSLSFTHLTPPSPPPTPPHPHPFSTPYFFGLAHKSLFGARFAFPPTRPLPLLLSLRLPLPLFLSTSSSASSSSSSLTSSSPSASYS